MIGIATYTLGDMGRRITSDGSLAMGPITIAASTVPTTIDLSQLQAQGAMSCLLSFAWGPIAGGNPMILTFPSGQKMIIPGAFGPNGIEYPVLCPNPIVFTAQYTIAGVCSFYLLNRMPAKFPHERLYVG